MVLVSWAGFWFSPDAVPGRIGLGVTTVLSIITQAFLSSLSEPKVKFHSTATSQTAKYTVAACLKNLNACIRNTSGYFIKHFFCLQVPYVKAMDVWLALTLTFIFATLVEFAIVNSVLRSEKQREMRKKAIAAARRVSL